MPESPIGPPTPTRELTSLDSILEVLKTSESKVLTINGVAYDVGTLVTPKTPSKAPVLEPPKPALKSFNPNALKHLQQVSGFPSLMPPPSPIKEPEPELPPVPPQITFENIPNRPSKEQPLQRCISEMAPELLNHRLILDEAPKRTPQLSSVHKQNEELKAQSNRLQEEVSKLKAIQKELTTFIL